MCLKHPSFNTSQLSCYLSDSDNICTKLFVMKSTCVLKVTLSCLNFIVDIKHQIRRGKQLKCILRANVCGDGGHISPSPEYRPGSCFCKHKVEIMNIWQAPSRTILITSALRECLHSASSIPAPCSLLLMSLNVACCYIRVYMISSNRVLINFVI